MHLSLHFPFYGPYMGREGKLGVYPDAQEPRILFRSQYKWFAGGAIRGLWGPVSYRGFAELAASEVNQFALRRLELHASFQGPLGSDFPCLL